MPSSHLILCRPLLLPSIFPSIRVFSNESVLHIRWPKYWSFSFSISPSNEYSRLISFRIDWFDLLPVQRTVRSLLQDNSLKASILWHSAFFMVQLSHPYMTTENHSFDCTDLCWQSVQGEQVSKMCKVNNFFFNLKKILEYDPDQWTLKGLLQHRSLKASILWHSAFFMVRLSHPYLTTGKTIALTRWTFVGKLMSLLFNTLPRFVIAFLPRSNSLLISWLQPPFAVILKPKKIKSAMVSVFFPNYLP